MSSDNTREAERRDVLEEIDRRIVSLQELRQSLVRRDRLDAASACIERIGELRSLRATIAAGKHERKGDRP